MSLSRRTVEDRLPLERVPLACTFESPLDLHVRRVFRVQLIWTITPMFGGGGGFRMLWLGRQREPGVEPTKREIGRGYVASESGTYVAKLPYNCKGHGGSPSMWHSWGGPHFVAAIWHKCFCQNLPDSTSHGLGHT